jgi:hypothetical protein
VDRDFEQAAPDQLDKPGENAAPAPATGDERADAAVAELTSLADRPVDEHPAVLGDVYQNLSEILGEVEAGDDQSPA